MKNHKEKIAATMNILPAKDMARVRLRAIEAQLSSEHFYAEARNAVDDGYKNNAALFQKAAATEAYWARYYLSYLIGGGKAFT